MLFIRFALDKCFAMSCGTLHDPLRAPDFLLPTVSTRADLMKLGWQNSAACFGPAKRLCIRLTKSMNTLLVVTFLATKVDVVYCRLTLILRYE
jgi:hypothetical protein